MLDFLKLFLLLVDLIRLGSCDLKRFLVPFTDYGLTLVAFGLLESEHILQATLMKKVITVSKDHCCSRGFDSRFAK